MIFEHPGQTISAALVKTDVLTKIRAEQERVVQELEVKNTTRNRSRAIGRCGALFVL